MVTTSPCTSFIVFCFVLFSFLLIVPSVYAQTSLYRPAGWIATDGIPAYNNTNGCQISNDNLYCSRPSANSFANLYFGSFGNLADFNIPQNAIITKVHIRVTGKNDIGQYAGVTAVKNAIPFTSQCQFPPDMWTFFLGGTNTTQELQTLTSTPGNGLINCITASTIDQQRLTFRLNYSSAGSPWSSDIDNFEIAFDYTDVSATPTLSPTPTPTPIPIPVPFLDLPWNYEEKGESFNDAAMAITSYFDHEYPLLSSGLFEQGEATNSIVNFNGNRTQDRYSSHDGYDYANLAHVHYDDKVLAAAAGWARYIDSCSACGNMIVIDHENGYQTRYMHLQSDGLIINNPKEKVWVDSGQGIGKVGFTGNVDPQGISGAHIHFGVFEDKNHDGNFDDNIPDGATDPFGWQSKESDPWANYSFFYNGLQRQGNMSFYLWKKTLDNLDTTLTANGGVFQSGKYSISIPQNVTNQNLKLTMTTQPQVTISTILHAIGSTISISLQNAAGDFVTATQQQLQIMVDFSQIDISKFKVGTFAIYSSTDSAHWQQENTDIDYANKKATTQVNHLTQFALVGELADTIAPTTTATFIGHQGQPSWFRSPVQISLDAIDNTNGLGVDKTFYKVNDGDWQTYINPLLFSPEGHYSIIFSSIDKAGNVEAEKKVSFAIDKTPPEAQITYSLSRFDIAVTAKDSNAATITLDTYSTLQPKYIITDVAGNTLSIHATEIKLGKQVAFSIKSLQYNSEAITPLANNIFFTFASLDKNNNVHQLDQYFSLKDDKKIFTSYLSKMNQTKIYTKTLGNTFSEVDKDGIVLLKLHTQNSTLKYSY